MQVPALRPGFPRRLALIAAAGLGVRLLYVLVFTPHLRGLGDATYYSQLGNLIASGHGFVDPGNGTPTALHPPLFPLVLALWAKLGFSSYQAQRLLVCLLGTATIALVGLVGRRVAGARCGLIAAGLAAVYPTLITADGSVMSETLLGTVVAACALVTYALLARPSMRRWALLGVLIGLAALTRAEAILLLPLLALPVALRLRNSRVAALALTTASCAAVLAPWVVRNLTTFDKPVLLSTNDGNLIAGANCASTYSGRDIGSWDIRCVPYGPIEDESLADARFRRAGTDYASHHAGRLPLVLLARVGRTFELFQPARQAQHAEGRAAGIDFAGAIVFLLLVPLGAYGAVLMRRRDVALAPLLAPFGVAIAATVVGYGVPRFRHPADVALVPLAAVAIDALLRQRTGSAVASPRSATTGGLTSRFRRSAGRSTA